MSMGFRVRQKPIKVVVTYSALLSATADLRCGCTGLTEIISLDSLLDVKLQCSSSGFCVCRWIRTPSFKDAVTVTHLPRGAQTEGVTAA
jgi:hypothetical protein